MPTCISEEFDTRIFGFTILNLKEIDRITFHGAPGCACIFFTLCYLDRRQQEEISYKIFVKLSG